jgi:hypothetical protein
LKAEVTLLNGVAGTSTFLALYGTWADCANPFLHAAEAASAAFQLRVL